MEALNRSNLNRVTVDETGWKETAEINGVPLGLHPPKPTRLVVSPPMTFKPPDAGHER